MEGNKRKGKSKGNQSGYPSGSPSGKEARGKDKFKRSHGTTKSKKGPTKFGK